MKDFKYFLYGLIAIFLIYLIISIIIVFLGTTFLRVIGMDICFKWGYVFLFCLNGMIIDVFIK